MTNKEETIPCKWCSKPTYISGVVLGNEECNGCWEVTSRLDNFLKSQKARDFTRQVLSKHEETIYFRYIRDPFATESKEKVEKEYENYRQTCQRIQDSEMFSFDKWCDAVEYVPVKR